MLRLVTYNLNQNAQATGFQKALHILIIQAAHLHVI